MPTRDGRVIVTFDSIAPVVERDTKEGVDVAEELKDVPGTDAERAAFVGGFEQAKFDLAKAGSRSGVMVTLDARAASLLVPY